MSEYAGSEWLKRALAHRPGIKPMSPLGERVADLLGELYLGIYHIEKDVLNPETDWSNTHWIEVKLKHKSLATFDFDYLTRLVFLAHHLALRVEVEPCSRFSLRVMFHARKRTGDIFQRHPRLTEAVERFEKHISSPEYADQEAEAK